MRVLFVLVGHALAHPCAEEVSKACPDRPVAEIGACLSNVEEHEELTEISSECMDFMAMHAGCPEMQAHCAEEDLWSDTSYECVTKKLEKDNRSERCANTLPLVLPEALYEEWQQVENAVTDEQGLSDADHEARSEEQEQRRAERTKRLEAIKAVKAADTAKEAARLELEKWKRENPEEYQRSVELEQEEHRQKQSQKKRERLAAAAAERLKAPKIDPEEEAKKAKEAEEKAERRQRRKAKADEEENPRMTFMQMVPGLFCLLLLGAMFCGAYFLLMKLVETNSTPKPVKQKKEKKKQN